jgi:integrating conjugative element protein (TIGR03757 family)
MISPITTRSSTTRYQAALSLLATVFSSIIFSPAAASLYYPVRVEVFSAIDQSVVDEWVMGAKESRQLIDLQVYKLDVIHQVEAKLSRDLTADPEQSKRLALQHIQVLDNQMRARMQHSAIGLAMAMQYGIDRYPVSWIGACGDAHGELRGHLNRGSTRGR